jgi:hypothetical protein
VSRTGAGSRCTIPRQNGNGAFEFPTGVAQGGAYAVTVQTQPVAQTCSVSQGTGMVGAGDVSSVAVVCSTNTFNVGGTVSGLSGTVALQNNGGDPIAINNDGAFTFLSPVAQGASYAVTVLVQPATQTCTVSNGSGTMGMSDVANVGVVCSLDTTTLSVTARHVIPVNGSATLTVTNTGTAVARNVAISLPAGWTDVSVLSSSCGASLAPMAACSITLASPVSYVAQNGIEITADNVPAPPTTALAFSIDGYLVFSVDSANSASVVDNADVSSAQSWAYSTSTTSATSLTQGATNTAQIVSVEGPNAPAAYACSYSNEGGASTFTWYLPAICQLSNPGGTSACPAGIPSIHTNLVRLGFRPEMAGDGYWSSTEASGTHAWAVALLADPTEVTITKNITSGVRCARSINY